MMAGVNKIWSSVSWILMTRGCMLTVQDYVCTRGLVSTPADDKRVYGRVSELGTPWYSLSPWLFLVLPFYCEFPSSQPDERASRRPLAEPDENRQRLLLSRAHSIRNNNDLSAICCKMSARSRGITRSRGPPASPPLPPPKRPMKLFTRPTSDLWFREIFFARRIKHGGRIIPRQRSNLWSIH